MLKKKQLLTLSICLILLIIFTACYSSQPTQTRLERILETGTLTIGNCPDYPPFESVYDNASRSGFDIDIMEAIATSLGLSIEWKNMDFSTIITAVQNGQVDVGISGFSYDEERAKQVDFSDPYYTGSLCVLAHKEAELNCLDDLPGKTIAVQMGTTCASYAQKINEINVKEIEDFNIVMMMLKNKAVDGIIADKAVAENYADGDLLILIDEPLSFEENSLIIQKGNEDLLAALNTALNQLKEDGTWQTLMQKWHLE